MLVLNRMSRIARVLETADARDEARPHLDNLDDFLLDRDFTVADLVGSATIAPELDRLA